MHEEIVTDESQYNLAIASSDPITGDGTKKSARGLLAVQRDANNELVLEQGDRYPCRLPLLIRHVLAASDRLGLTNNCLRGVTLVGLVRPVSDSKQSIDIGRAIMSGKDEESTEAEEAEIQDGEATDDEEVEGFVMGGMAKIGNIGAKTDVPTIYTTRMRTDGPGDEFSKRL